MSDSSRSQRQLNTQIGIRLSDGFNENMKLISKIKKTASSNLQLEGRIRLVRLRQNESNSKLGFSLRGGKLPA